MDVTVRMVAYGNVFLGTSVGLVFTREGTSFGVVFTRCLQNTHHNCGTSTTRRMSLTATRTRVKRERWRQSWRVAFSKQRDRPIRCHASMTRYSRGANQGRNSSAPVSAPAVYSAYSDGVSFTPSQVEGWYVAQK